MTGRDGDEPSNEFASGLEGVNPISDRSKRVSRPSRPASGPRAERSDDPFVHPDPAEPRLAHRQLAKPASVARLRSGALEPQRQIDLHQMRAEDARRALARTIEAAARAGESVLLVVHGRGRHQRGRGREARRRRIDVCTHARVNVPAPSSDHGRRER